MVGVPRIGVLFISPREDRAGVVIHRRFRTRRPGAYILEHFMVRKFASPRKNLVEHRNESRFFHFHVFSLYHNAR